MHRKFAYTIALFFISIFIYGFASADVPENKICFIENKRQVIDTEGAVRNDVLFSSDKTNTQIFLRKSGISYVMSNLATLAHENEETDNTMQKAGIDNSDIISLHRVDMEFYGANKNYDVVPENKNQEIRNYYLAHCLNGITGVNSFNKITYTNLYKGIDAVFYGGKNKVLKYDFEVSPNADPSQIQLEWKGASEITIENNKLIIQSSLGTISECIPRVYQLINGKIIDIKTSYKKIGDGLIGFDIGHYDKNAALIIDPSVWLTYFGGSGNETSESICTDSRGDIIINGIATSINLPVQPGAQQVSLGGAVDSYLAKFNDNNGLIWCTYFGGNSTENAKGLAIDKQDNIYHSGNSKSTVFPTTAGTYQASCPSSGSSADPFVAKFTANGLLAWCTFYGSTGDETLRDIAVNSNNEVILIGETLDSGLPMTGNSYQPINNGNTDWFIAKLNSTGTGLIWSTYLGGPDNDIPWQIAIDKKNNTCIVGSTDKNFPMIGNSFQLVFGGGTGGFPGNTYGDAVIAKLNNNGQPLWTTYYGGLKNEHGECIAVDDCENVIAAGLTFSQNNIASPGAYKTTFPAGNIDAFVVKFDASGNRLWGTYFGANAGPDYPSGIAIDKCNNNIYIFGDTYASTGFTTGNAYQQTNMGGGEDLFVAGFDLTGNLIYSSFAGSNKHDEAASQILGGHPGRLAIHNGYAFFTAETIDNATGSANAYMQNSAGGKDAIIGSIPIPVSQPTVTVSSNTTQLCAAGIINYYTVLNSSLCDSNLFTYNWSFPGGTPSSSTSKNPSVTYSNNGIYGYTLVFTTPCGATTLLNNNFISVSTMSLTSAFQHITCNGYNNGRASASISGATGNITYQWSNAQSNSSISGLNAGTYSLTITDGIGCTIQKTFTITEPSLLQAFIPSKTNEPCYGETVGKAEAAGLGGTLPYAYAWNNNILSKINSNLAAGIYSLTISDANNCTATASAVITAPSQLHIVITNKNNILCNGNNNGTIHTSVTGGIPAYTYQWTNNVSVTDSATNLTPGNYSITVTDNNGCNETISTSITEPAILTNTISATNENCLQRNAIAGIVISGGTANYIFLWNNGSTNQQQVNLSAGVYSVTVTDANGCSDTNSITITNLSSDPIQKQQIHHVSCYNNCDGNIQLGVMGNNGPYLYAWNNGQSSAFITNLCAAKYTCTVSDVNGCKDTAEVTINKPTQLFINLTSSAIKCYGDSNGTVSVNTTGGTPGYSYSWSNHVTSSMNTGLKAGTYSLTVSDTNGCTVPAQITITEPSELISIINPSLAEICKGTSATLSCIARGGTQPYFYQWSTTQTTASINVQPSSSTNYNIEITDLNGCKKITGSTVIVHDLPQPSFTTDKTEGCGPLCITFTNTTSNTANLLWDFGTGFPLSDEPVTQNCFTDARAYNISLTVTDSFGCSTILISNNYINVFANPIAAFQSSTNETTILNSTIVFTNQSLNASTYEWSFGNEIAHISTLHDPTYIYSDSGTYIVRLIAINKFGCKDTAYDEIKILPDFIVYVPNTFTPNNDGLNDIFLPVVTGATNYTLLIYDRWGALIFTTKNKNQGWDGKANDGIEMAQIDTYIWKIELTDLKQIKHNLVGKINLLK